MKKYVKPVVLENEELAEGVYAASGSECYTVNAYIHQTPQEGRGDYRIQANASHGAGDGHHSSVQILTLSFNEPVTYKGSNGILIGGDNTSTIQIHYTYHSNGEGGIGLGDVVVTADPGLALTGASLSCNYSCDQH